MNLYIHVLFELAVGGFIVWLLTLIPKPAIFNQILIGIAVLLAVMFVLKTVPGL